MVFGGHVRRAEIARTSSLEGGSELKHPAGSQMSHLFLLTQERAVRG